MAYGATVALRGVSLAVEAGEVVAVVGANGAGKTSLLRAFAGLLHFSGGRVTEGTVDVASDDVASVLEGGRVFRDLTVEENLRAGAHRVRSRAQARAGVEGVLDRIPLLAARRTTPSGHLSGGEQQLLAIGRALVASPRVLLLDEPTVGLAGPSLQLLGALVAEAAAGGAAVLVAEQEPVLAVGRTERLEAGRLLANRSSRARPA